jgi:ankyrin repeat protein
MNAFKAIEANDLELFCRLVNRENVNTIYLNTQSLLRFAMRNRRIDFIRYLISIGADVNYADHEWWSALMRASCDNDHKLIEILLNAGADVTYVNSEWYTSLGLILRDTGSHDCAKLLIDRGAHKHLSDRDNRCTNWMEDYITDRTALNQSILTLLASHKHKKHNQNIWFIKQDKYVIKIIGKHIWSMRMLEQ